MHVPKVAIYHDPGKGTNTEGQTIKQLKIQPTPDGKVRRLPVELHVAPIHLVS